MSRNKFGELVRKYIVDAGGNAERRVLGHLPGDYVGMNVYEALNMMLNILYTKDGASVKEAAEKLSKIANIYYEQAEEIVRAYKKYKKEPVEASNKFDKIDYFCDKYDGFRNKVSCICQESVSFKEYFAPDDYMEAVETIDKRIRELHAIHGLGLDGTHNTIKDLTKYIENVILLVFSTTRIDQLITPLVLWHPLYTGVENRKKNRKKSKGINHPKYADFCKAVTVFCHEIQCFRTAFVIESYDEAFRDMDGKIREFYNSNGIGDNGLKRTINDLEGYIEKEAGVVFNDSTSVKYIEPMVMNHPYYQTTETIEKNKKEGVVMKEKKTRGHDKYRFFINKPSTENEDINRVLEEAEKEGYDLVSVNNTNTNNHPLVYVTASVFNYLDKEDEYYFDTAYSFETKTRKKWYFIYTSLTITELFEAIKKAEESKVKVVVERYRVTTNKAKS